MFVNIGRRELISRLGKIVSGNSRSDWFTTTIVLRDNYKRGHFHHSPSQEA